jgi:hypothetical protein
MVKGKRNSRLTLWQSPRWGGVSPALYRLLLLIDRGSDD